MHRRINIFGVDIDSITFDEALRILLGWIAKKERPRFVVTPNVNHLVLYQDNVEFRHAYSKASLILPDGRYVILLSNFLKTPLVEPVNGSDLVPALMASAHDHAGMRVFLLGAMPGVAESAADNIQRHWPHVDVVDTYSPPFGFENDEREADYIVSRVNEAAPDLLVVGITPPKQEIWVAKHISRIQVPVTVCAGGTIDFMANIKRRAPPWMQRAGLEWVFRAASEPKRLIPRYMSDGRSLLRLLYAELRRKRKSKV